MVAKGRAPGTGMDWEFAISRCNLAYIEQINKVKGGTSSKEPTCQYGSHKRHRFPGSGRSPGGGHGNTLQYSCLETLIERGASWATVHRVTKSQTQMKPLSTV